MGAPTTPWPSDSPYAYPSDQEQNQDQASIQSHSQSQTGLQHHDNICLPLEQTPDAMPPPLMHFPHCRLEITTPSSDFFPTGFRSPDDTLAPTGSGSGLGKIEQVALPGTLVRSLLARLEEQMALSLSSSSLQLPPQSQQDATLPPPSSSTLPRPPRSPTVSRTTRRRTTTRPPQQRQEPQAPTQPYFHPHPDDTRDWVFSRCLLADFTDFREDEAAALSQSGSLCCWASVVLHPLHQDVQPERGGQRGGRAIWDLGFVVHRVGVRDPDGGWCECF